MLDRKLWYKLARNYLNVGKFPFNITNKMIEIFQTLLTEEQAKFLVIFKKKSYNFEQIKSLVELSEKKIEMLIHEVLNLGALIAYSSEDQKIIEYQIPPFFPGLLEFTLMKGKTGEKEKKLAILWQEFFDEMVEFTQKNYDLTLKVLENVPAMDRIIPVENQLNIGEEVTLFQEDIVKIIHENDPIAVATCYCRHRMDLLENPCIKTNDRKTCIILGESAQFCILHGFAEMIDKETALKIIRKSEDEGLVHKAFHTDSDITQDIHAICNCCDCCCGTFTNYYAGGTPLLDYITHRAFINEEECLGCGFCLDKCSTKALELINLTAKLNEEKCLGCGICAHFCPENAIKLERIESKILNLPPPRLLN